MLLPRIPPKSISLGELAAYSLSTTGGPIVGKGSFARQPSTPALAAQIAKVEVDPGTGRTRVLKLVASQDVGFAINPMVVEGTDRRRHGARLRMGNDGGDAIRRKG